MHASPDQSKTAPTPEVNSRQRDRCEAALCLHGEGLPTKEIARRIGASRNAVRCGVRAGRFVSYRRAAGSSRLNRIDTVAGGLSRDRYRGIHHGLHQDEAAVRAAIVEPWSRGPIEGQVNRLKLIKRSMYGRDGFDLLRQRVLRAA